MNQMFSAEFEEKSLSFSNHDAFGPSSAIKIASSTVPYQI